MPTFASRNRIPFSSAVLDNDNARTIADSCGIRADQPAVIFGKDTVISDPTPLKVAQLLGPVVKTGKSFCPDQHFNPMGIVTLKLEQLDKYRLTLPFDPRSADESDSSAATFKSGSSQ